MFERNLCSNEWNTVSVRDICIVNKHFREALRELHGSVWIGGKWLSQANVKYCKVKKY